MTLIDTPSPDACAGLDKIGATLGRQHYAVRSEGYYGTFASLPFALARWRQTPGSELIGLIEADGKSAECVFDGTAWGPWE